jgi:polysaccharide biosynthesis protein PslH
MKILMISSFLPYPLYSGGHIRLYNLIKELSKKHQITLICEKRENQTEADKEEISKICKKVITINRKKQWSAGNILKTAISKNPFLITGHTLPAMTEEIERELEKEKYDLIHVETFYVMQNLPKTLIPVVLVEHNIEYLIYERYTKKSSWYLKPLLNIDVLKIKRAEEDSWKRANKLVAVSEEEKALMGRSDVEVVANGVDTRKYQISNIKYQKQVETVLFIGEFRYLQNIDAVRKILTEIWPKIHKENKNLKLWIVGRKIPEDIKKIKAENIFFDENAPSKTEEIYEKADILLAPIYIGGGTSYKILEAMASGVAVVTTSLGAEGIIEKGGSQVMIGDTPEDLAKAVLLLVKDNKLKEEKIRKARKLIEEKYDWKIIAEKLDKVYNLVINK